MHHDMTQYQKKRFKKRKHPEGEFRRGVYILPNLLTTGNLFAGFFSIVSTIHGEYEKAAVAILISWIFDILDGKVARLTRAASRFGIEYDSLVDLVAFGVAPALLAYLWAFTTLREIGWLASFAFVACGALRLARFNVMATTEAKQYFLGLPIPGAAGLMATSTLFLAPLYPKPEGMTAVILLTITFALAFLMVSNIHYSAFKELEVVKTKPIRVAFFMVVLIVIIAAHPRLMLFAALVSYVLSGPSVWIARYLTRYRHRASLPEREEQR